MRYAMHEHSPKAGVAQHYFQGVSGCGIAIQYSPYIAAQAFKHIYSPPHTKKPPSLSETKARGSTLFEYKALYRCIPLM
jgi:hypothetical protein